MKTAIKGKLKLKLFWDCEYSGNGIIPVGRIFKIGKLILSKVVCPSRKPFDFDYYKASVLERLRSWYDVRWEKTPGSNEMWHTVYSHVDGGYVGTPECAYRLMQQNIGPASKARPNHKVCSIGFNPTEQKWYGWSHRAIYGFGIGDIVSEGDCCASRGWTEKYLEAQPEKRLYLDVGFEAKTLDDAKKIAIAFAGSVS